MLQADSRLLDFIRFRHLVGPFVLWTNGDHAVRPRSDLAVHEHGHRLPVHVGEDPVGTGPGKVFGAREQTVDSAQDFVGPGRSREDLVS